MNIVWNEIKKKLFNKKFLIVVFLIILTTILGTIYLGERLTFTLQMLPMIIIIILDASKIKDFNKEELKKFIKEEAHFIYGLLMMIMVMVSVNYDSMYLVILLPFFISISSFIFSDEDNKEDDEI